MTGSHDAPAIEVDGLCKTFRLGVRLRRVHAVRGISFSVPRGAVFGFLGPNGAGKTTTIKILTGLIHATAGSARLFGVPIGAADTRMRTGYLPEHPYFYDYLSSREILAFYGRLFGLDRKAVRKRSSELLERVGLSDAGGRPLRKYSKGMLQRIGIAQALINDPELVVLDEPMSGLDPIGRKEVRDLLIELKRAGKTIFFSSHILADIEMICDEVAIIDKGLLVGGGTVSSLQARSDDQVEVFAKATEPLPSVEGATGPERIGELWRYASEASAVDDLLGRILAEGGSVVSVTPRRMTLEDVFVEQVRAGSQRMEPAP